MRSKILLAALAATAAFASPAMAQTSAVAPAVARGTVLQPLTLVEDQQLDFGTVLSGATPGTVAIDSALGGRTVTGISAIAIDPGQRGVFLGLGTNGQTVQITLNGAASLARVGGGASISVNSWDLDGGAVNDTFQTRVIADVDGAFVVGVGAEFAIGANQMAGLYQANYSVTANYF